MSHGCIHLQRHICLYWSTVTFLYLFIPGTKHGTMDAKPHEPINKKMKLQPLFFFLMHLSVAVLENNPGEHLEVCITELCGRWIFQWNYLIIFRYKEDGPKWFILIKTIIMWLSTFALRVIHNCTFLHKQWMVIFIFLLASSKREGISLLS